MEDLRLEMTSYGKFIWTICGFKTLQKKGKMVCSPTFYSWKGGYKLVARLYPNGNGDGEGTHLSIFVHLLEGRYDKTVPRIFPKTIELSLLAQKGDEKPLTCQIKSSEKSSTEMRDLGEGFPKFISLEELKNSPFLVDDTLVLQVDCTK